MKRAIQRASFLNLLLGAALLLCGLMCFSPTAGAADFADAPDDPDLPGYPTLLAHNGARHLIGGPWLGQKDDKPDEEIDGQPDPNALGDDADGNDDENGVTIPPLHPGQVAVVTLDVRGGGVLQAWIDFDADGIWKPDEQVFNGFLLAGPQAIAVAVPAGAALGTTYARFRISSTGGLAPDGLAEDGEVEDYAVLIEPCCPLAGWCQLPDVTQSGIGLRVDSNDGNVRWLADDFSAISDDSIGHVRLWGSWKDDRAGIIKSIHLAVYPNDPAGPGGADPANPYAKPDLVAPVWQEDFDPNTLTQKVYHVVRWAGQWWWDPAAGVLMRPSSKEIWQIDIPACSTPLSGSPEAPEIYWLAVEVHTERGEFGWNTRQWPYHSLADAVWDIGTDPASVWKELRYQDPHPYQKRDPNSVDMAFCLGYRCCAPTCRTCVGPTCAPTCDPLPTRTGPTLCDPCPTKGGPTICDPCPTRSGPTICDPCPTKGSPTICDPCPTKGGPTICDPCPTRSGPTICDPCPTRSGPTMCDPCPTQTGPTICDPCPTQTGPTRCDPCPTQSGPTICDPCPTQSGPTICDPCPTQSGPTICDPCPTRSGPTICDPCPTQTGPTICTPCVTQSGPTLCDPCPTQSGATICTPCVTQSGATICTPCVTQSGPTICTPCVTMSATCVCPPPVTIGCPIFGQGKSRSQSAAARVVYTQQKDWLITDFTCPPIEVDCPAAVPEAVSLSGEARQPEQPRVSKDTRGGIAGRRS